MDWKNRPLYAAARSRWGKEGRIKATLWQAFLVLALLLALLQPYLSSGVQARQSQSAEEKARQLLNTMTPQEKVGQLFLVTFSGNSITPDSEIYNLITKYQVGGVILRADKGNIPSGEDSLQKIAGLTQQLQNTRWEASQTGVSDPSTNESSTPPFIPLFIGMAQEGDGYPYDQILEGVTPLPNEMALGATWDTGIATTVGQVMGAELSAVGVNMLLGPSLDVLETPYVEGANDLGTRTFGGDPYWVGKMGQAYISGIHTGSDGKIAVISKHFPGAGGSDRLPEVEVATIRRSLEQLKSFDLMPFFSVTGNADSPETTTDGLLVSHTRYQGFQGTNIRATTRPVSLDQDAMKQLMGVESLANWRSLGGVLVSDDLGGTAMRRYYESINQPFDMPRRVALNAFLARNDLLYVGDFASGDLDSFTSASRTLEFFAQKYQEDSAFAPLVDESVLRILTLKYRMFDSFNMESVVPNGAKLKDVGTSGMITLEVAQEAATLISPSQADLDVEMPDPPNMNDRMVFITDTSEVSACPGCPQKPLLGIKDFEEVILHRYGPQAGGQVSPNYLTSYSLQDLQSLLNAGRGDSELERDLRRANWVVFAMLNGKPEHASYKTLNRFLSERADLYQGKRLLVFAFSAPYYMDATNITKLTAYYGMYSKTPQFVDVAAYLLFRELRPQGALPVSVPGVGYDLNKALFPKPDQVIPLAVDGENSPPVASTTTPEIPVLEDFWVGDLIPIRTGIILDQNNNPVPDGTPVEFIFNLRGETHQMQTTHNGVAQTNFLATDTGTLEVRAESEPAKSSDILRINIQGEVVNGVTVTPTLQPTSTPTPTEPPPAPTLPPPVNTTPVEPPHPLTPQLGDWIMAMLIAGVIGWSSYRLAALIGQIRWGIRGGFLALIGGLVAYSYLALKMPGSEILLNGSVSRGVVVVTLAGALLGLLATWLWRTVSSHTNPPTTT